MKLDMCSLNFLEQNVASLYARRRETKRWDRSNAIISYFRTIEFPPLISQYFKQCNHGKMVFNYRLQMKTGSNVARREGKKVKMCSRLHKAICVSDNLLVTHNMWFEMIIMSWMFRWCFCSWFFHYYIKSIVYGNIRCGLIESNAKILISVVCLLRRKKNSRILFYLVHCRNLFWSGTLLPVAFHQIHSVDLFFRFPIELFSSISCFPFANADEFFFCCSVHPRQTEFNSVCLMPNAYSTRFFCAFQLFYSNFQPFLAFFFHFLSHLLSSLSSPTFYFSLALYLPSYCSVSI